MIIVRTTSVSSFVLKLQMQWWYRFSILHFHKSTQQAMTPFTFFKYKALFDQNICFCSWSDTTNAYETSLLSQNVYVYKRNSVVRAGWSWTKWHEYHHSNGKITRRINVGVLFLMFFFIDRMKPKGGYSFFRHIM